ncbi:MAG: mycothiol synthase [Microbacteriaceae bacterium]
MSAFPPPPPEGIHGEQHSIVGNSSVPSWLTTLTEAARAADGQPPFSDQSLIELRHGSRLLLSIGQDAAAVVSATEAEIVVAPSARMHGRGSAMLDHIIALRPQGFRVWAHGDHPGARALARSRGLTAVRTLLQLRMPLSDFLGSRSLPSGVSVTEFAPGADESDWLELNARAFAGHPEQSGLTAHDLASLTVEPWFDASAFLVARDGSGRMLGFVWVKIEPKPSTTPQVGEIYVLGVSPEAQGSGLGRALLDAGLGLMSERGLSVAHLYVEGDNTAALRLYRGVGFTEHSIDVQYERPGDDICL